eukprot:scaffold233194_cov26-Prasinocladus_malaysianus.AAC.1
MTAAYYTIGSLFTIVLELGSQGFDLEHVTSSLGVFGAPLNFQLWGALWYAVIMASKFHVVLCLLPVTLLANIECVADCSLHYLQFDQLRLVQSLAKHRQR